MTWLRRQGRGEGGESAGGGGSDGPGGAREIEGSAAPGLASLFEGLKRDGGHTVLDMAVATSDTLNLYRPFAQCVRFAGLHPSPPHGRLLERALDELPPPASSPYDTLFLWDVLERLFAEERPYFVAKLSEMSVSGARLHAIVDGSGSATFQPVRILPIEVDRIRIERVGPPIPAGPPLLPAELERVLRPFEVVRGFTLRSGLREYVAVKR